jgi:hypothetical protein
MISWQYRRSILSELSCCSEACGYAIASCLFLLLHPVNWAPRTLFRRKRNLFPPLEVISGKLFFVGRDWLNLTAYCDQGRLRIGIDAGSFSGQRRTVSSVLHGRLSGSGEENCVVYRSATVIPRFGPPWNHFLLRPSAADSKRARNSKRRQEAKRDRTCARLNLRIEG